MARLLGVILLMCSCCATLRGWEREKKEGKKGGRKGGKEGRREGRRENRREEGRDKNEILLPIQSDCC